MQIWLFGMFLYLFGEPAIERYLAKKVMVVTSTRETGGTEAPALTLIAIGKNASTGWKKEGLRAPLVDAFCGELSQNQSIQGCIEENTYNISETSKSVNIGVPGNHISNVVADSWIEDFTFSFMGRTYTLNITKKLQYDSLNDSLLRIKVDNTLDYHIFIHDLKYFYATSNPESEAPSVRKTVFANELPFYFPFALTEVEELDVHHDHCNEDLEYDFKECVKESFSRKVGCKTMWDRFDNSDLQSCATIQQFR